MSLEKLSAETVASGREHPFVATLERELEARLVATTDRLVAVSGTSANDTAIVFQLGGRACELRQVLRMIREAGSAANG